MNDKSQCITGGKIFTSTLSDGTKVASLNVNIAMDSVTRRQAMTDVAEVLEAMAADIRSLARKSRS